MKTIFMFFSLLVFTFFLSCSKSTDEGEIDWVSPVVNQTVTTKTSSSVAFITKASWGNSCGRFSRSVVTKSDSIYSIKIFGKQPNNSVCATVMITFDAPVAVNITSSGSYTFKFWKSDSTSIDTTLIFQ